MKAFFIAEWENILLHPGKLLKRFVFLLQGFFIFVLHCLRSGEIRNSCNRKLQRWKLTQSSNFSTSKSSNEHTASTSDKNPLRSQFTSTESLQDTYSRHHRVTPISSEMDDKASYANGLAPVSMPHFNQNSV